EVARSCSSRSDGYLRQFGGMADRATSGRAGPRGTRWKAASTGIAQADGDDGTVRQLVLRAQRGDDLALGEIYVALFERVRRYMEVALEDLDGADDAAQQVFVKAFEALPRYRDTGVPFRSWVFRIAHNEAVDLLDRAKRE